MAVAVVTDTTHYLPHALLADFGVREVPLYVGWDRSLRREAEIDDLGVFPDELRTAATVPTTSQPSVGDQAGRLADRGRELFGSEPLFVSEVGPVIGAHVGPGLLGVGGLPHERVAP